MQRSSSLTVFFEAPFWVGVFERVDNGMLSACKVNFGSEPKDYEVWEYILQHYHELDFSPAVEAERRQFREYYAVISDALDLGLSAGQLEQIAGDRADNMENYIPYPGVQEVLETLSKTHRLGIISDTWPSIDRQLEHIGVSRYFSFRTYSCYLGVFKPDSRMYLDALAKSGAAPEETVFIDDGVRNLEGAAAQGIYPILIAANPESDVETGFLKIRDLRELIREG